MSPLWFKARTFGWGWTPATWEGWVVVAVFLALLAAGTGFYVVRVRAGSELAMTTVVFLAWIALLVAGLVLVAWLTGESPGWRWGK